MKYVSTRGEKLGLNFEDILLKGLAGDGGLYLPESYPQFRPDEMKSFKNLSYQDLAVKIIKPFVEPCINEQELKQIIDKSYQNFDDARIAPLKKLNNNIYILELFHGPTFAFKDYALQFLGNVFDFVLAKQNKKITIVGATSGDTGSAAIEACKEKSAIDIFILHPKGKVSEVQRKQMTGVKASNVYNIALEGNFDDCQSLVKDLFADKEFNSEFNLSAVNSINWARIMAQVVYYFYAALAVNAPDKEVSFAVPTGNFGNIFAGYVAKKMGLPIKKLIVASNKNDILPRFFENGVMEQKEVSPSLSPSMDIQVSSNFERLLFEVSDRDADVITDYMASFKNGGIYQVKPAELSQIKELFCAYKLDDDGIIKTIRDEYLNDEEIIDPHTASGVFASKNEAHGNDILISLATAHYGKFMEAVTKAIGFNPPMPQKLKDALELDERYTILANDISSLKMYIKSTLQ